MRRVALEMRGRWLLLMEPSFLSKMRRFGRGRGRYEEAGNEQVIRIKPSAASSFACAVEAVRMADRLQRSQMQRLPANT